MNTCGAQADVADRDRIDRAFASIIDALGVPDVVVYNASIYQALSTRSGGKAIKPGDY